MMQFQVTFEDWATGDISPILTGIREQVIQARDIRHALILCGVMSILAYPAHVPFKNEPYRDSQPALGSSYSTVRAYEL